nr:DNA-directed RNA polymerase IV subunit 1 isoform X1 [Tanacetum cinerariifolium]
MSPKNKAHYESKKEEIHLLLTGIGDEIYSTVDACKAAHEMWIAIERLQQEPKSHNPTTKQSSSTRSNASIKFRGKEIAKPITPPYELASKEDSNHEQAKRDKDMQKNLALIAKYFKKIYKPTNNNLRTSSNSRNKNMDTTLRKPKRVKDSTYHKEKMLMCKQAEKDSETDTEPLEQVQNDVEYNVFTNVRQHSEQPESTSNTCLVEKDDSNVTPDSSDMCDNDIQTDQNAKDESAATVDVPGFAAMPAVLKPEHLKADRARKKASVKEITVPNEVTEPALGFLNPASQCHTCGAKYYMTFNHASLNLLSNEVMANVNVLGLGVRNVIATQSNGTTIITIQGNLVEVKAIV